MVERSRFELSGDFAIAQKRLKRDENVALRGLAVRCESSNVCGARKELGPYEKLDCKGRSKRTVGAGCRFFAWSR